MLHTLHNTKDQSTRKKFTCIFTLISKFECNSVFNKILSHDPLLSEERDMHVTVFEI